MSKETREESRPDDRAEFQPSEERENVNNKKPDTETRAETMTRDEEMEYLRSAAEEAEKRVLMAQAEAENFRKRMRRDVEDQLRFASVPMVTDILSVRDNLLRALAAAESTSDAAGLKEGVAMVAKQLDDALAKYAVQEIPALGEEFDPNCHEAISQMPSEEYPAGVVTHVAQSGFRMHDRVIRPSQVVVSSGPSPS